MLLLFIGNAGLTVSEFAGVGASMEIFGVSRYIAVPRALAGIWAVTVFGNYSQAERVFAETADVERSLSRRLREAPFFYGIYTVQLVAGAAVALLPGNAVNLVINARVLNGFITPVLLTYILILANRRCVLGDAANGPVFRAVATLCVIVVGLLSAVVLVQTVAG